MTGILDQLTDAMNAAASTVREEELRPLSAAERRWRQSAWAAPVAAAVAVVLVIGLAVSVSNGLFRTRSTAGPAHLPAAPHRFYLATDTASWRTVVRSTATGAGAGVVAVVPVWPGETGGQVSPVLAAAGNGMFYLAAFVRGAPGERIYRFRITAAGQVTGFARVPGGALRPGWVADALAASPDGSLVAVGAYYFPRRPINPHAYRVPKRSAQLVVIHPAPGAQSIWRGGSPVRGYPYFRVGSLSWTSDPHELAVLGVWCRAASDAGGEACPHRDRQAQVRAIDPAGNRGGSVLRGRLLLRQSPR